MTAPSNLGRRVALRRGAVLSASALAAMSWPAFAQSDWPDHLLRVIVPYGPGQGADSLMRFMADGLAKSLNQTVMVENRPGAGGNIGADAVAKATPNGYTFLLGTNATNAANEFLYSPLPFNPASDFDGVAMLGLLPMVICTSDPELPTNGIAELIARARAKPDSINVGLPSTTASVVLAQFIRAAQAPLFGVNYKTSAQSMTDVMGGQIPLVIDTVTAARPQIASGRLRALGISSLKGSELLPGVKSIAEQGVAGFDLVAWDAMFAPRGTPADIVQKLSEQVRRVLEQPQTRRQMLEIGIEPDYMAPAALDSFVKSERLRWGDIIRRAGIQIG